MNEIFNQSSQGFSPLSAPELGGAFAAANSTTFDNPNIGLDNNAHLDM